MKLSMKMKAKFFEEGNTLPKCVNIGCDRNVQVRDWKNWSFKSECSRCAVARIKGLQVEGVTRHKKSYCENKDGHLGWVCPVPTSAWKKFPFALDIEHIDGDHQNNSPENVETICKLCHGKKTILEGDCHANKKTARQLTEY